jgi:hypothetical protein
MNNFFNVFIKPALLLIVFILLFSCNDSDSRAGIYKCHFEYWDGAPFPLYESDQLITFSKDGSGFYHVNAINDYIVITIDKNSVEYITEPQNYSANGESDGFFDGTTYFSNDSVFIDVWTVSNLDTRSYRFKGVKITDI